MCLLVERRDPKPGAGCQVNRRDANDGLLHGIALGMNRESLRKVFGGCQILDYVIASVKVAAVARRGACAAQGTFPHSARNLVTNPCSSAGVTANGARASATARVIWPLWPETKGQEKN